MDGTTKINDIMLDESPVNPGGSLNQNFREISVGAGTDIFKVNSEGVFAGANDYSTAPWRVNFQGVQTLDGSLVKLQFKYNGVQSGSIWADSAQNMVYWGNTKHYFQNIDGTIMYAEIGSDGLVLGAAKSIFFASGTTITDTGATCGIDRTLTVSGDVALDSGKKFQIGTTAGINYSDSNVNTFSINIVGGIVTQFTKNS